MQYVLVKYTGHPLEITIFSNHLHADKCESASICCSKESLHHCHRVTGLFYIEVVSGDTNQPPHTTTLQHIQPTSSHNSHEYTHTQRERE